MTKVGWRSKAIYLLFALALVVGLFGGVTSVYAQSVLLTATPTEGMAALDVDFTATVTPGTGPYTYTFDWIFQYRQQEWDAWGIWSDFPLLFDGADTTVTGSTSALSVPASHRFDVPGFYIVQVSVYDSGAAATYTSTVEVRVLGIIPADIAFDVKGACHTIEVKGVEDAATAIIWSLGSGVDLTPADIVSCTGDVPETWEAPLPGDKQTMIRIKSMKRGDIHIFATIIGDSLGNITLHTEKKWGELQGTELDLDVLSAGKPHIEPTHAFGVNEIGPYKETLEDLVEGTLLSLPGNKTMGHAVVHWFMFEDTEETEALIDDLMDHVASTVISNPGDPVVYGDVIDDAYWEAYGKYDTEFLRDLIGAPSDSEPYDVLEYYASDLTQLRRADPTRFEWTNFIDDQWYFQNETADSWPAEVRGTAQAELNVDINAMAQGESICVMIVLLVTYPGSGDPKDDPFNGENIIVLEKGKKCFTKGRRPEVTLVKTPQVRWAGEKVVLEQDWSDYLGVEVPMFSGNQAEYRLDEASIGVLYGSGDNDFWGGPVLRVEVNGTNPTSEVVLESEFQGKADVEVALYYWQGDFMGWEEEITLNYGFPVLFLAFEDVTSAVDITPEADRLGLTPDPGGEDADVAVQVRGWFTSEQLGPALDPDTMQVRAEKIVDTDGDGVFDRVLPRGRYVLPDDWPALAGGPYELRPNWDLMDMANDDWGDSIQSTDPLGPYNTQFVANEDPEEVADAPCIGPFNTLQQWSTDDMWFAEAVVPADFTIATPFTFPRTNDDLRTTVVPDGAITAYDCPMPQALVIFNVQPGSHEDAAVSELLKTDLYGYGYTGDLGSEVYHSPFYQVEVPSSEWIPAMGYNYDSWSVDGPYPYWEDLKLQSILANTVEDDLDLDTDDVEVYCDNHGIAAVQIDALEETGVVWITATADFPMSMKKGQYPATTSDPLRASWGEILEIDPDLEGTPRTCEEVEGCIVTFTNLSEGGELPYTKVIWNFGDLSPVETYTTGPEKDYGGTVTHQYTAPGQYIVCITIVDGLGFIAEQCEGVPGDGYIKVGVTVDGDLIEYYMALTGDPNVVELADLMAAADDWIAGTIPAGFTDPITTIQLMALADEWISS